MADYVTRGFTSCLDIYRSEYHPLEFAQAEEDQLLRKLTYHESLTTIKTSGGPSYAGLLFIGE